MAECLERFESEWLEYREITGKGVSLNSQEAAYLKIQGHRRAEHRDPLPLAKWMQTPEILEEKERNAAIGRFRASLGIHSGDENQPPDSPGDRNYELRKNELQEMIDHYDWSIEEQKLPGWMAEKHPAEELKMKIREALYRKYGYIPGSETKGPSREYFDMLYRKQGADAEYAAYESSLIPVTPEQREELDEFVEAGYINLYPKDLSHDQAESMLEKLRAEEQRNELAEERRLHPMETWQHTALKNLYNEGRIEEIPEGISQREARELIDRIIAGDPANEFEKKQIKAAIRDGFLPYSTEESLSGLTEGKYKELSMQVRKQREIAAREQAQWEREHPRKQSRNVDRDL